MVTRNSQDTQLNTGGQVGIQQSQEQLQGVNTGKYQSVTPTDVGQPGPFDGLIQTISGSLNKLASHALNVSMEESYVRGAAQAEMGLAEETIQANPLTKDWATAGFRDTAGRIKMADTEAQIAADMKSNADKTPEQFAQYLSEKRNALMPSLDGMSLAARKSIVGQQVLSDKAAIRTHLGQYQTNALNKMQAGLSSMMSSKLDLLDQAKKSMEGGTNTTDSYVAATGSALQAAADIANNPVLSMPVKQKMVKEIIGSALNRDHQLLYDAFTKSELTTDAFGKPSTLRNVLSQDDQSTLAGAHRESLARTFDVRSSNYHQSLSAMESEWQDPTKSMPSLDSVKAFIAEGHQYGFVKGGEKAILDNYSAALLKKNTLGMMSTMVSNGDVGGLARLGKSPSEAVDAWVTSHMQHGGTLVTATNGLVDMGGRQGIDDAYKAVGKLNAPAFQQMFSAPDAINAPNKDAARNVIMLLDKAEASGKTTAMYNFLTAFDEPTQNKITAFREALKSGKDPTSAIQQVNQNQAALDKMPPAVKAAMGVDTANKISESVADMDYVGIWGSVKGYGAKALSAITAGKLGSSTANAFDLKAFSSIFESEDNARLRMVNTQKAYADELNKVYLQNPYASKGSAEQLAVSRLLTRSVPTASGPLQLPSGVSDIQSYFGVPAAATTTRIGEALYELHKPQSGNSIAYTVGDSGVTITEMTGKGATVYTRTFNPKDVAPIVEKRSKDELTKFSEASTTGISIPINNGRDALTYNGANSAGVSDQIGLEFRNNLVKNEGVKDRPYQLTLKNPDGTTRKDKLTIGVGMTGDYYVAPDPATGLVDPTKLREGFLRASNDALNAGLSATRSTGVSGKPALLLYSELAYHAGNSFTNKESFAPFLEAMRSKDVVKAQEAFKSTRAWTVLPDNSPRRKHYLDLIKQALDK